MLGYTRIMEYHGSLRLKCTSQREVANLARCSNRFQSFPIVVRCSETGKETRACLPVFGHVTIAHGIETGSFA